MTDMLSSHELDRLARHVDPTAVVSNVRPLTGGVSAEVLAMDLRTANGEQRTAVVRAHGAANLLADPAVARHEYEVLKVLRDARIPVPAPLHADDLTTQRPRLVVEFVEGEPVEEPEDPGPYLWQLAEVLAALHALDLADRVGFLPDVRQRAGERLTGAPETLDDTLQEGRIRAALAAMWPPPRHNREVLLHGDFWPGNVLWQEGRLGAVIDWEDAAIGDPLADLGNARFEISIALGSAAMEEFTAHYLHLAPSLDLAALPTWDLYAALRPAGKVAGWGLDDAELRELLDGHAAFVERALPGLDAAS